MAPTHTDIGRSRKACIHRRSAIVFSPDVAIRLDWRREQSGRACLRNGYNGGMNRCEVVVECGDGISLVWMGVSEAFTVTFDQSYTQ